MTVLILVVLVSVGAAFEFEFERGVPGGNIKSYSDSVWWAISTVTTVGYGDRYPVTMEGRGVAALLMFVGIATVSLLSAGLTTVFVGRETEYDIKSIVERLEAIEKAILTRREGPPA
jgi:voltage-gated potassium channel